MKRSKPGHPFVAAATAVLVGLAVGSGAAVSARAADARPVVVELFTSQGCSSCPPADAFLAELAGREDVIALGYHVDYWDYIGWKDPFASPDYTSRQRTYARKLGLSTIYTPQIVVDGHFDIVGSHRAAVTSRIQEARGRAAAKAGPVVRIGDAAVEVQGTGAARPCQVLFVSWRSAATTDVRRGENAGRRLQDANIVTAIEELGTWIGTPATFKLPADAPRRLAEGGFAVLVQSETGEIVAAQQRRARN